MGIGNLVFAKMGYTSALKSPIFSLKCVNALQYYVFRRSVYFINHKS